MSKQFKRIHTYEECNDRITVSVGEKKMRRQKFSKLNPIKNAYYYCYSFSILYERTILTKKEKNA